ncbi:hypothetical protein [Oceanibium sediminis]|uniref:hypothetical protein n=1 Tax=Oceanibium sediminis TaxID=2026339 RepID=UPI0013009946|nr:hypothetical protein [Oceanibium sediminis]
MGENVEKKMELVQSLADLAFIYFDAARKAEGGRIPLTDVGDLQADPAIMNLMSHSIELSMKSYLALHDYNRRQIREFGHDILLLYGHCRVKSEEWDTGFAELDLATVTIISDLHKNMVLRYLEEPKLGLAPTFNRFYRTSLSCLESCGAIENQHEFLQ